MSFQPVVTLTNVPRDNSSFTLTDATPTDNISGWGSPNAPSGPSSITSLFGQVQGYGETPVNANGSSGSVATTMVFSSNIIDGVNTYIVYYGLLATLTNYTISADGLTLTSTDPNLLNLFDGVSAISIDGIAFPAMIASKAAGTITMITPLPSGVTGVNLYKYYIANVQALTVNNGEAIAINGISTMPVEADVNPNVLAITDNILLKLAAEIAFNCGNISKAHEAARLLSGTKPFVPNNCPTCG